MPVKAVSMDIVPLKSWFCLYELLELVLGPSQNKSVQQIKVRAPWQSSTLESLRPFWGKPGKCKAVTTISFFTHLQTDEKFQRRDTCSLVSVQSEGSLKAWLNTTEQIVGIKEVLILQKAQHHLYGKHLSQNTFIPLRFGLSLINTHLSLPVWTAIGKRLWETPLKLPWSSILLLGNSSNIKTFTSILKSICFEVAEAWFIYLTCVWARPSVKAYLYYQIIIRRIWCWPMSYKPTFSAIPLLRKLVWD